MSSAETLARRAAHILGAASGAAKAIAELERRRSAGEAVDIFQHARTWIVGPASVPSSDPQPTKP